MTDARCLFSCVPNGLIWYAVLAAVTDVANGDVVPTDSDAILNEARCLQSCIPAGMVPYALLVQISKITGGTGQSCLFCEDATDANGVPPCDCALWYRKDNGRVWYWDSGLATWIVLLN